MDETQNGKSIPTSTFQLQTETRAKHFASPAQIKMISSGVKQEYFIGPGDIIDISVWKRPEISRKDVVVAPDGIISIPKVGIINVKGKTVATLSKEITTILSQNYEAPETTIIIREFHNNKAFVLGRVSEPGVVNFPGDGTLLEALALAGGLPHIGKETFLTKCAIIRGKDTIIWIDLRDLLDHGNMTLNARIMNNDIIFIPEAEDEMVMVLGEVEKPGPVMLKRGLNLVDAVMQSGGYTNDSDLEKVYIIRQDDDKGIIKEINFRTMLESGDFSQNYALMQDDIVYVAPSGMTKLNYVLKKLMPSLQVLSMSASILDNLGITTSSSDD
ncbi:MAG: SLBB domain-containing protein [Desulfotalea sp.]